MPYREPGILNSVSEVEPLLQKLNVKSVLLVTDKMLRQFGATAKLEKVLADANIKCVVYDETCPNPTVINVEAARELYVKENCEALIAFGGGSSMDTGKGIGIIVNNPEYYDVRSLEGVAPTKNPCVPIIAVPTTAGTAAEVTINYVITDVEKKRKFVCVDPHDIPVVAVVDPDMMASMPKVFKCRSWHCTFYGTCAWCSL